MATNGDFAATANFTFSTSEENTDYAYDYATDYGNEVCVKTNVRKFGEIFTPVFFSIVVILSLFGNILVIVILAMYENLRSLTNALVLNLALSDLLFTAGLPFWIYYYMYGWNLGELACKTVSFVFYIGFYSSGFLLILMTVHRYIAVMSPLSDIVSTKGFYSVLTSVVIWAVSVFGASPALIFTQVEGAHCTYKDSFWSLWGIYQQNILFIVSSLVFLFCYSQIMRRLMRPTAQRRRNKTLKLILTLIVVFFVGWAPYNIVIFLDSLYFWLNPQADATELLRRCVMSKKLDYAKDISRLFAFSHCCLNPVFYVFVGVKFRTHLEKMIKSWGKNKNSLRNRQSRLTITSLTSGEEFSM